MSLKPVLETLDGLDEGLKAFYVEQDGKWRLDVDGGFKTSEEITGLTSALAKEREGRGKLEKALKKFEGVEDPAEALKALEVVRNLDSKKLIDAGEVEKLKADIARSMQAKIDELQTAAAEKDKVLAKELIGGRFARSKYIADRLAIPQDLVEHRFGTAFKVEDGRVVAYDGHGNKIYSKDKPGELAEFDEALSMLVDSYPYKDSILRGSAASGAGVHGGQPPGRADWRNLPPEERMSVGRENARR